MYKISFLHTRLRRRCKWLQRDSAMESNDDMNSLYLDNVNVNN